MKKVYFLVNRMTDFGFAPLLEKHLGDCEVAVGTTLPAEPSAYDLVVLWSYRKKVPVEPGCRNIILFHSSRLPEGRGFAPIYNTIARDLERYTVSGIFAAAEFDTGDLIVRASFRMRENYIAADLRRWDEEISVMLVSRLLDRFGGGELKGVPQVGTSSWWERRCPEDGCIDTTRTFAELIPHLRASESRHPAFFMLGQTKYVVSVQPETAPAFPDDLEIEFFDSAQ
jgi:methionyl-tRNA formyltransferase